MLLEKKHAIYHFKRQPHKMVEHTQTICRLLPTIYLIVLDNFMRLALKELTLSRIMFKTGPAYSKNLGV